MATAKKKLTKSTVSKKAQTANKARLEALYEDKIRPALQKELGLSNKMQVPRLNKIVVNVGVKEAVSDIIQNRLSDPRVEGFISITEVDISPNLKKADIFVSIMGSGPASRRKTFTAIEHAARHIQTQLGRRMTTKFCPHLEFHEDNKVKNTLEILRMIDEASKEWEENKAEHDDDEEDDL